MKALSAKQLPNNVMMRCFSCNETAASHTCNFKSGDLLIQICLCKQCMNMDAGLLLSKTIGLKEFGASPPE